jgi:hypothetical protein
MLSFKKGGDIMKRASSLALRAALLVSSLIATAESQAATGYGCFKVTAASLNIRTRPYSSADVVGTAYKGEILIKRKPLCTLRGFWCAVRKGDLDGYADKANMQKLAVCP